MKRVKRFMKAHKTGIIFGTVFFTGIIVGKKLYGGMTYSDWVAFKLNEPGLVVAPGTLDGRVLSLLVGSTDQPNCRSMEFTMEGAKDLLDRISKVVEEAENAQA